MPFLTKLAALLAIFVLVNTCACKSDFRKLDLDNILVQDGDLPAGFSAAQISNDVPYEVQLHKAPEPDRAIVRGLQRRGIDTGTVFVLFYADDARRAEAYTKLADFGSSERSEIHSRERTNPAGVGDQCTAMYYHSNEMRGIDFTTLVFSRGPAVVYINFDETSDIPAIVAYAKRLDARLAAVL